MKLDYTFISIYKCDVCESHMGLFVNWDDDDGSLPNTCMLCGEEGIEFVGDSKYNLTS